MNAHDGTEKRWDGTEKRATPPELHEILYAVRELRKAQVVISKDMLCLKNAIEPFQPMLKEMLDTRERMKSMRWAMLAVIGATVITGAVSFLAFVGFLLWEWVRTNLNGS